MRETRRFGFALLKRFLLQALPTMGLSKPSRENDTEKPAKRLAYLVDFGRMPAFYCCLTADEVRAWTLPKSGGSVFGDDRSLTLIRQYDEEGDRFHSAGLFYCEVERVLTRPSAM
ncbi:hypothetical protein FA13DRAFT_1733288 [Coprinellus micaceus]|uniref:Uncharacterized protein n=1 Tax=Coprinellus micaceus TaxID=71717 RepID=A0A4Y7TA51_COPMI|nr:hypothetical protein FA13DRAFT_1733288 [Coprinellus micaceus]